MSISDAALVLSLLNSNDTKKIEGRTRIQKIVYILKKEDGIPFTVKYKPYFYGPYSDELAETLSNLQALDMIVEEREHKGNGIYQYNYVLTASGLHFANRFVEKFHKEDSEMEKKLREKTIELTKQPLSDVVRKAKSL